MSDKKVSQKGFVAIVAPLTLALGMGASTAHAGDPSYATDSKKQVITNNYGECWKAAGGVVGKVEACGDKIDKPAPAPMAAPVDGDADGDGVKDSRDKCPNTPKGDKVDADGCSIVVSVEMKLMNDHFDFDSAKLKPGMEQSLSSLAEKVMSSSAEETLEIVGHTDSTGPDAYNQKLSIRRAQAVADYLAGIGIDRSAMTIEGMGESSPVADNGTREGRSQNRRVEVIVK